MGYKPAYADEQASARRWTGTRLERDPALRKTVLGHLAQGWSPEQVSGRLAMEQNQKVISHESIYRFIYAQIRRTKNYDWRQYLPRGGGADRRDHVAVVDRLGNVIVERIGAAIAQIVDGRRRSCGNVADEPAPRAIRR